MAAPKAETLLADAIKSGRFDPAYALSGDNEFRKEEALRQLLSSATDPSTRDFNVDVIRGSEADPQGLEIALNSMPLMADRRVVVIRDAGAMKKSTAARLAVHLENPSPQTVLVLVYAAGAEVPAPVARLATVVPLEQLSGDRLLKWITRQAKAAHGVEIEPDAAGLLLEVVGSDLLELDGELDKLSSYSEGRAIDTAAVSAVVGVRPGQTIGALLEAVMARDARHAAALVPAVLQQPKVTAVTLVMSLAAQLFGVGWCRARRDAGTSPAALQREGFAIARRVFPFMDPRAPPARLSGWIRASADWSLADVDAALDALLAADVALKQTRIASEEQIVSTAVLGACAGAGHAAAAA